MPRLAILRKCSLTETKAVNPEEEYDLPLMQAALIISVAMYWVRYSTETREILSEVRRNISSIGSFCEAFRPPG